MPVVRSVFYEVNYISWLNRPDIGLSIVIDNDFGLDYQTGVESGNKIEYYTSLEQGNMTYDHGLKCMIYKQPNQEGTCF